MLKCIYEHYGDKLTLKDIADAACISESEVLHCFSEAPGTTPVAYLVHYRSEQAADLLLHTDRSITEIAVLCGFFDISYFIRTFRRFYGTSPSRYRREHRQ